MSELNKYEVFDAELPDEGSETISARSMKGAAETYMIVNPDYDDEIDVIVEDGAGARKEFRLVRRFVIDVIEP